MFKLVLVCALAAVAFADVSHLLNRGRPLPVVPVVPRVSSYQPSGLAGHQVGILRQTSDIQPDGSYNWAYETENGINAEEQAQVRAVGPEDAVKTAQGQFSWTSPEGEQVAVSYIADENGYQPQGTHLPVAPPVPPQILRALEWIAAHPQPQVGVTANRRY